MAVDVLPRSSSLVEYLQLKTRSQDREDYDDPFFVIDLGQLMRLYSMWQENLPTVAPFFAVKADDDPVVVKVLAKLGCGFDCASKAEIRMVLEAGSDPEKIIFAHPCKNISHIKYAAQVGVSMMTFDNKEELYKVKTHFPHARLVVRIFSENTDACWVFCEKYGCSVPYACKLMDLAKELELNVVGVSFHVGSLTTRPDVYKSTMQAAMKVVEYAEKIGYKFSVLDIGGGFPGLRKDFKLVQEMWADIKANFKKMFSGYPALKVIAEPGRYFCNSSHSLATVVTCKRSSDERFSGGKGEEKGFDYFVTDGYHGSLHWPVLEKTIGPPLLVNAKPADAPQYPSIVYGPTLDTDDIIAKNVPLPELNVGDWIYFEEVGAYTNNHSQFCGYVRPFHYYYVHEELRDEFSATCWRI